MIALNETGRKNLMYYKTLNSRKELLCRVPQRPVLGLIVFNKYLNDLLLFLNKTDACKFSDDTTLFVCRKSLAGLLEKFERNYLYLVINMNISGPK